MAERSVTVRLRADVAGLVRGMQQASSATQTAANRMTDVATRNRAEWDRVANTMLGVGAAIATGLGLATKAAVDWESQFAGVKKTVDDTEQGYAALNNELRALARELPASHQEIAATAEAAGQLGVARDDIAGFSRVMIDLGETTNLSADEAATALARFSTITGASYAEVDRLGSTLVGLGNNFAATESEILEMATRLAGMGTVVGLAESDILGLSAAMTAVGINAEAGGTAMSRSMSKINDAVLSGSDKLNEFARVAGMSADEFRQAWTDDPAQALTTLIEGLGRVNAEGGNVNQTLRDLGITNQRERDAMLRLAGASDELRSALSMAGDEYARNNALSDEAALRYETAAARMQVAINNIRDAAISMGAAIMPVVADAADALAGLAGMVAGLPPEMLSAAAGAAALVGGLALLTGGLMKAVVAVAEFKAAMSALGLASFSSALGRLGLVGAGVSVALIGVGAAVRGLSTSADEGVRSIEGTTRALESLGSTGGSLNNLNDSFRDLTGAWGSTDLVYGVNDLTSALERLRDEGGSLEGGGLNRWVANMLGMEGELEALAAAFDRVDVSLAGMVEGGRADAASRAFAQIRSEAERLGLPIEQLVPQFDNYRAALEAVAVQLGVTTLSQQDYIDWMGGKVPAAILAAQAAQRGHTDSTGENTGAIEENTSALQRNIDLLNQHANTLLGEAGAQRNLEAAIDAAEAAQKRANDTWDDAAGHMDRTSAAGRDNEAALEGIRNSALEAASAMEANGASSEQIAARMQHARDEFIQLAEAMGVPPEKAAALATQMGLLTDREWMLRLEADTGPAERQVEQTKKNIDDLINGNGPRKIIIGADGGEAEAEIDRMKARLTQMLDGSHMLVTLDADGRPLQSVLQEGQYALMAFEGQAYEVRVGADGQPVITAVEMSQDAIDSLEQNGPVVMDANNTPAVTSVEQTQNEIDNLRQGSPPAVAVDNGAAITSVAQTQWIIDMMRGKTVALDADNRRGLNNSAQLQSAIDRLRGKSVGVEARVVGASAVAALGANINRVRSKTVTITTRTVGGVGAAVGRADGGPIPGWSPHSRADNVPIWATAGEFMHSVASVDHYGLGVMDALNRRLVDRDALMSLVRGGGYGGSGGGQRLASGGPVGRQPAMAAATPPQVNVTVPAASAGDTTITLQLDGRELAHAVHRADSRERRR